MTPRDVVARLASAFRRPTPVVGATPADVVHAENKWRLLRYRARPEGLAFETPILLVPSLINRHYVLDLMPGKSFAAFLVSQGHDVFCLDWGTPGPEDRYVTFEDVAVRTLARALHVAAQHGAVDDAAHVLGYCLGGTLAAIAAAALARRQPDRLASLTLLAAQTDFEHPGEISLFIDESQVSFLEDLMSLRGTLDAKQMAGAFQLLRSNDLIWSYRLRNYLLGQRAPMNDLMAWNADPTRMPYRMHSEYLRQLFLDNQLAEGRYRVDGRAVALTDIRVPIFAVGTLADHVAPWRSVYKIHLLSDAEVTFALTSGGHNAGIVSEPGHANRSFQSLSRHAHDAHLDPDSWLHAAAHHEGSWWPAWQQWLAARSSARVDPPPIGAEGASWGDAPGSYVHLR